MSLSRRALAAVSDASCVTTTRLIKSAVEASILDANDLADAYFKDERAAASHSFSSWLQEALCGGAREAHRATKKVGSHTLVLWKLLKGSHPD